jgi:exopolysaccharide transport family protein
MSGAWKNGEDADIDLAGLFGAIWRRRMLVLASTVCLGVLGFAGANVVSPKYQSEARVLIEERSPELARRPTDAAAVGSVLDEAGVASQVALLQSTDLIKKIARDFKLHERPEFDPSADPSITTRFFVMLGLMKNPLDAPPDERVLGEFTKKLQVFQVDKSRVIAIQFSSKDPALANAIPNAIADVYLSLQAGAKLDTTNETAKWLEPEIANLREKVREAEAKAAEYRSQSDLFQTGQQSTFSEQQLNDISQELARVRGDRATAEARAETVRNALTSGRGADSLGEVVGSQMIQRLKETQSGIEGQIADLSTQLLDGHPRIKGLRSQLVGIREQINSETRKILASLESEARVAKLREQQLLKQLGEVKADTATSQEKRVGLNALEREAAAQRQLLETYLSRYREAMSERDMNATPADARIISRAPMPTEPYFPKTLPITIVTALAGFVLSSVFILLTELFSGRAIRPVRYEADIEEDEERTPAPQAALVKPDLRAEPVAVPVAAVAKPAASKSLLALEDDEDQEDEELAPRADAASPVDDEFSREAVADHLIKARIPLVASVSLSGDEGSAAVVGLARLMAENGARVVVVDMTGSAIPTQLMAEQRSLPGVTNLLVGEAAYSEIIHGDVDSDAHIVPQGDADPRQAMRGVERIALVLGGLARAYDCVIVDCGAADPRAVSRIARAGDIDIILSGVDIAPAEIEETGTAFLDAGFEDVMLMLSSSGPATAEKRRRAA